MAVTVFIRDIAHNLRCYLDLFQRGYFWALSKERQERYRFEAMCIVGV